MARKRIDPFFPVVEEYETTFEDMQVREDRVRWQGGGFTGEFPHNAGSYEEKIDEEQNRQISNGRGRY